MTSYIDPMSLATYHHQPSSRLYKSVPIYLQHGGLNPKNALLQTMSSMDLPSAFLLKSLSTHSSEVNNFFNPCLCLCMLSRTMKLVANQVAVGQYNVSSTLLSHHAKDPTMVIDIVGHLPCIEYCGLHQVGEACNCATSSFPLPLCNERRSQTEKG